MKRAFLGLALSVLFVGGCTPATSKCEKAIDNIIRQCQTCAPTSSAGTSSRGSDSCRLALMDMCGPVDLTSSASSSSGNNAAFLDCVANATSCDVIMLCS
jgi:hypothetical protein